MKTVLPFLLTIVEVTAAAAAPSRSDYHILKDGDLGKTTPNVERLKRNVQHQIQEQKKRQLEGIVESISVTKKKLSKQVLNKWVPDDLMSSCTPEEICKARKILATFEAKDLGLEKWEWILPRQLLAYTEGTDCSETPTTTVESTLSSLLKKINTCALREFHSIYYNPEAQLFNLAISCNLDAHLLKSSISYDLEARLLNSSTSSNPEAHLLKSSTSNNPEAHLLISSTSNNPEAHLLNSPTSNNPEAHLLNSPTSYNPEAHLLISSTSNNPEAHLLNSPTSYNSKLNSYTLSTPTTQNQHFCLYIDNIK